LAGLSIHFHLFEDGAVITGHGGCNAGG
jgi:hypothetical protein